MSVFNKIIQIFKVKDLRNKILFVLALLIVFRIFAHVPVPGVDITKLQEFFEGNQLFGLLNMFTGGAMSNFSVVMLGVGPYITASIIMQLLTMIFPGLKEAYQENQKKFNQLTRCLTVPLAIMQSYGMIMLLGRQGVISISSTFSLVATIATITGGTVFLMWIGELITEKNIGNGISLIIFAGIIARLPLSFQQNIATWDPTKIPTYIGFLVVSVLVVAGIVFITEAQRNIPISYAKRVRGMRLYGGMSTHLPLRVNQAGMIPIIFAMSVMLFPGMVASFLANSQVQWLASSASYVAQIFQNQLFYASFYFILVVAFTFFYTAVTFDPKNISENLQKQGGFIPGIRPGSPTAGFLHNVINRITLAGAVFLGVIAVLPFISQGITGITTMTVGGAAVIIVVGVVLESMKQVEAQLVMRDYEGF